MSVAPQKEKKDNILDKMSKQLRPALIYMGLFSFFCNLLMLALPLYSLQVLDRVISSASISTLVWLTIVMTVMFIALAVFTVVRSFGMIKIGEWIDSKLGATLLQYTISTAAVKGPGAASGSQNLRDLATVKGFVTGAGINALFDLPWSVIYLLVILAIHPVIFFIGLIGAILLFLLGVLNEVVIRKTLDKANEGSVKSMTSAEIGTRNAEVVEAMGMAQALLTRWKKSNQPITDLQSLASYRSGIISAVTKFIRMMLQIMVLGVGAYLVLKHQMTTGAIIANSILIGRALAPFDVAISSWKQFVDFRKSLSRLDKNIDEAPQRQGGMSLPAPKGRLSVEKIVFAPPGTAKATIKGISFVLNPGEILGVIGASAAGKSTIAKLLVGVWKPLSGVVRLDGADVYTWNRDEFGKYIGYVPQGVELFDGTVRDNIARLQEGIPDEMIIEAAQQAGAHEMILQLSQGYDTDIGISGAALSAGQRQRVALARAFLGTPKFLVLDEPNANLDTMGEAALVQALANAKQRGITTVIISHRPSILNVVDKLMVMNDGIIEDFGNAAEVAAKFTKANPLQQQPRPRVASVGGNTPGQA